MTSLTVCIVTGLQAFMFLTPTAFVGTFIIGFPLLRTIKLTRGNGAQRNCRPSAAICWALVRGSQK
jgi:hypothetical protein